MFIASRENLTWKKQLLKSHVGSPRKSALIPYTYTSSRGVFFQRGNTDPAPSMQLYTIFKDCSSFSLFNSPPCINSRRRVISGCKNVSRISLATVILSSVGCCHVMPRLWISPGLAQSYNKGTEHKVSELLQYKYFI